MNRVHIIVYTGSKAFRAICVLYVVIDCFCFCQALISGETGTCPDPPQIQDGMKQLRNMYLAVSGAPPKEVVEIPDDLTAEKMVEVVKLYFAASIGATRNVVETLLAQARERPRSFHRWLLLFLVLSGCTPTCQWILSLSGICCPPMNNGHALYCGIHLHQCLRWPVCVVCFL